MSTNDGGAAFPHVKTNDTVTDGVHPGMSLRAYLAGQAMAGMLSSPHFGDFCDDSRVSLGLGTERTTEAACAAVNYADALIAALSTP